MSPDLLALLAAIRETPEDELPRLALADWCLEQPDRATQARGEFIHASLRRSRLKEDPAAIELDERMQELERHHRRVWYGALRQQTHRLGQDRGMVIVEVSPGTLAKASWEVLAQQRAWPWVLTLVGRSFGPAELPALAQAEAMTTISRLELPSCGLATDDVRRWLAGSAMLRGLRALELRESHVTDDGIDSLAGSPHLEGLRTLGLFDTHLTAAGIATLASGRLTRLTALNLGNNRVGAEGARALAGSRSLARLRKLWLHNSWLGNAVVIALARSFHLSDLQCLDLARNDISDDGVVALAGWPGLAGVTELDLSRNRVHERGALALAESPHLANLTTLRLDGDMIGDDAARALTALPRLERLYIRGTGLSTKVWFELKQMRRPVVQARP
jgi:uncharacterized protein (TIGR02996 family)